MAADATGNRVCPGTYDPVTLGHLDIIRRAAEVFEQVIVAVVNTPVRKQKTLFTIEERIEMIEDEIREICRTCR